MSFIQARILAPDQWVRANRHRHIELPADLQSVKAGGSDADDFKGMMLDRDLAPDRRGLSTVFPLPECFTEHSAGRATPALIVLHGEQPS